MVAALTSVPSLAREAKRRLRAGQRLRVHRRSFESRVPRTGCSSAGLLVLGVLDVRGANLMSRITRVFRSSVTVALLVLYSAFVPHGHAESLSDLTRAQRREFLLAGYTAAEDCLDDIDVTHRIVQVFDPQYSESFGKDPNRVIDVFLRYAAKGAKRRTWFYRGAEALEQGDFSNSVISDGSLVLSYQRTKDDEAKRGRALLAEGDGESLRAEPLALYCAYQGHTAGELLAMPDARMQSETETINGLESYRISGVVVINNVEYELRYWLAPERDCLPVRMELWDLADVPGRMLSSRDVVDFEQLPGGVWFPTKLVHKKFGVRPSGEGYETGTDTYSVESVALLPELDEENLFSTSPSQLPVGVLFEDRTVGMRYVIGEGALGDEAIEDIVGNLVDEFPDVTERLRVSEERTSPGASVERNVAGSRDGGQIDATGTTASSNRTWWVMGGTFALISILIVVAVCKLWGRSV